MNDIVRVDHVFDYNDSLGCETLHPLVSVIDFSEVRPIRSSLRSFGVYAIFLKDVKCGDMIYGRQTYDYQEGTLVCLAPGQVFGAKDDGQLRQPKGWALLFHPDLLRGTQLGRNIRNYTFFSYEVQPKGWALLFHPDLLRGTQLGRNIRNYTFFSYEVREALHLSEQERRTILDCLHNIRHELQHAIDRHSRTLVVNNIEMFLNYCVRFYDRQFITRSDVAGKDILARFERTLDDYFLSDKPQTEGLPTVQYCAQELHLSANYFGDLVKRLTGKTAQEHIRLRLIDAAKERIADPARSIAEVAYELGFKYPAHFTRLFKNVVGCTPNRYRNIN